MSSLSRIRQILAEDERGTRRFDGSSKENGRFEEVRRSSAPTWRQHKDLERRVRDLENRTDTIETNEKEVKRRVNGQEEDIEGLQREIRNLKRVIKELEEDLKEKNQPEPDVKTTEKKRGKRNDEVLIDLKQQMKEKEKASKETEKPNWPENNKPTWPITNEPTWPTTVNNTATDIEPVVPPINSPNMTSENGLSDLKTQTPTQDKEKLKIWTRQSSDQPSSSNSSSSTPRVTNRIQYYSIKNDRFYDGNVDLYLADRNLSRETPKRNVEKKSQTVIKRPNSAPFVSIRSKIPRDVDLRNMEAGVKVVECAEAVELESLKSEIKDLKKVIDSLNEKLVEPDEKLKVLGDQKDTEIKILREKYEILKKDREKVKDKLRHTLNKRKLDNSESNRKGKYTTAYYKLKTNEAKVRRFEDLLEYANLVAGGVFRDEFLKDFFVFLLKMGSPDGIKKLTAEQCFQLKVQCELSWGKIERIKKLLAEFLGFDFFSSKNKMQVVQGKFSTKHLYSKRTEADKCDSKKGIKIVSVVEATAVYELLEIRVSAISIGRGLVFDRVTGLDILVVIVADKGDGVTRLALQIANVDRPNSPNHLLIIGQYTSDDNAKEMKRYLGSALTQLKTVDNVDYGDGFNVYRKRVRFQVTGDLKFQCSALGHKGQSAKYNCCYCYNINHTRGSEKIVIIDWDAFKVHEPRTLQSYKEDSQKNRSSVYPDSEPLFDVEVEDYNLPDMHILQGVAQSYGVDVLIAKAIAIDNNCEEDAETLSDQKSLLKKLRKKYDAAAREHKKIEDCIETMAKVIETYEAFKNKRRIEPTVENTCASSYCLCTHFLLNSECWIKCDICNKYQHYECAGVLTPEEIEMYCEDGKDLDCYECNRAMTLEARKMSAEKKLLAWEKEKEQCEYVMGTVSEQSDNLEKSLTKNIGETREKLDAVFRECGADQRAWYQKFNGNQIHKLLQLESIEKIFEIFPKTAQNEALKMFMLQLGKIQSSTKAAELTNAEILELEENIKQLVHWLKIAAPLRTVTQKLHILVSHAVPFVKRNNSWGKCSEQGIESAHAIGKRLSRVYGCTRDVALKLERICAEFSYFNVLSDRGSFDD